MPIDPLPDRSAESLEAWLKAQYRQPLDCHAEQIQEVGFGLFLVLNFGIQA